jgi:hypothetical protein
MRVRQDLLQELLELADQYTDPILTTIDSLKVSLEAAQVALGTARSAWQVEKDAQDKTLQGYKDAVAGVEAAKEEAVKEANKFIDQAVKDGLDATRQINEVKSAIEALGCVEVSKNVYLPPSCNITVTKKNEIINNELMPLLNRAAVEESNARTKLTEVASEWDKKITAKKTELVQFTVDVYQKALDELDKPVQQAQQEINALQQKIVDAEREYERVSSCVKIWKNEE